MERQIVTTLTFYPVLPRLCSHKTRARHRGRYGMGPYRPTCARACRTVRYGGLSFLFVYHGVFVFLYHTVGPSDCSRPSESTSFLGPHRPTRARVCRTVRYGGLSFLFVYHGGFVFLYHTVPSDCSDHQSPNVGRFFIF